MLSVARVDIDKAVDGIDQSTDQSLVHWSYFPIHLAGQIFLGRITMLQSMLQSTSIHLSHE